MTQGTAVSPPNRIATQTFDPAELCERYLRCMVARKHGQPQPDTRGNTSSGTTVTLRINQSGVDLSSEDYIRYVYGSVQVPALILGLLGFGGIQLASEMYPIMAPACEKPEGIEAETPVAFLRKLYQLSAKNEVDEAIDNVIERFEYWLESGDWDACDHALSSADEESLNPAISLAILSMTLVEKFRLRDSRQAFYGRVRRQLVSQDGEQEADEDLRGLD